MSVLYYEDWTPSTYCPSGFKQVAKEQIPMPLFRGPSQLHDFGNACSQYHSVSFSLERRQDDNYENSIKDLTAEPSQPLIIGQPSQQVLEAPSTHISSPEKKEKQIPENQSLLNSSPGVKEITQTTQALTFETPHLVQQRLLPPAPLQENTTNLPKKENDSIGANVRCFCDDAYVVKLFSNQ